MGIVPFFREKGCEVMLLTYKYNNIAKEWVILNETNKFGGVKI